MKKFESIKGFSWDVTDYHKWSGREFFLKHDKEQLLTDDSKVVAIGSCFAEEVVKFLKKNGFHARLHPNGLQYNTFTMRDSLGDLTGEEIYKDIQPTKRGSAWRHPYKKVLTSSSFEEAARKSKELDEQALITWKEADLVIITLGLTEIWEEKATGLTQIEIPHPSIYDSERFQFRQSLYPENKRNLDKIYKSIRKLTDAPIVLTVSPVPLYATFSSDDVTVANSLSKSILRAVAGELCSEKKDVHYFPSFEMVMYSMDPSEFMKADGRHVSDHGVNLIMNAFVNQFSKNEKVYAPQESYGINLGGVDSAELKAKKSVLLRFCSKINKVVAKTGFKVIRVP